MSTGVTEVEGRWCGTIELVKQNNKQGDYVDNLISD